MIDRSLSIDSGSESLVSNLRGIKMTRLHAVQKLSYQSLMFKFDRTIILTIDSSSSLNSLKIVKLS